MAKKIKKSQILRHVIQLILFLTLPGLYVMTFSELKTVYQMVIGSNFNFLKEFPSLVEFTTVMLLTIIMGRWFCGWLCAFGAYNDFIYFISKKIFKSKFKVNEKVDSILKYTKYVILIFIIIISWTMGSSILESTSPWDAFGQITNISTIISGLLIGLVLLVLITIGAAFVERFFCRYLCPLGAVFAIISKIGIVKINKIKDDCGKCKACTVNCSMGLKLYKVNGARGGDCINCLKCTEVCPRNNANVNVLGQDVNQNLAGSVAMATMLGMYGLSNFGAEALTKSGVISSRTEISRSEVIESSTPNSTAQKYKDGTYTGSGTGFKGRTTKISVTIAGGKIAKVETLSYGDDSKWYERASLSVIPNIISNQSTSVDTVSGATYSSKGIISAVKDALSQAGFSDSTGDTNKNTSVTEDAATSAAKENVTSSTVDDTTTTTGSKPSDDKETKNSNTTQIKPTTPPPVVNQKSTPKPSNSTVAKESENTTTSPTTSDSKSTSTKQNTNNSQYKDGTYTGSGTGFSGTTTMSITISNGKITDMKTISNYDTKQYYNRAIGEVTSSIISSQSTSVDTVTGATYSSNGIIEAVKNALSKAK